MLPALAAVIVLVGGDTVLVHEQGAAVVLVVLVVAQLGLQQRLLVAVGEHLGHEIEAPDVDLPERDIGVHHRNVGSRIVTLVARDPDARPQNGEPRGPNALKAATEKLLQP
jgi:hypothetical protein